MPGIVAWYAVGTTLLKSYGIFADGAAYLRTGLYFFVFFSFFTFLLFLSFLLLELERELSDWLSSD